MSLISRATNDEVLMHLGKDEHPRTMLLGPISRIVLFALATVGCGRIESASPIAGPAVPERYFVEVANRLIRVQTAGLDGREPGQVVVVFESGGGQNLYSWGSLLSEVAEFAPVLGYERPGVGLSEWDGLAPSPQHSNAVLHRLLQAMEVPPPYVLVGHSWGGVLIQYFADRYKDEVAGLIYLDPTDIRESPRDMMEVAAAIRVPVELLEGRTDEVALARAPPPSQAEWRAIRTLLDGDIDARMLPGIPSVPTVVINSDHWNEKPPAQLLASMGDEKARAYQSMMWSTRLERMNDLLPVEPAGSVIVADGAGHYVHVDAPELTVKVIREVVSQASTAVIGGR